jgi:hypothetical protein
VFFQATHDADRRTVIALATKSATVATAIALFVALVVGWVMSALQAGLAVQIFVSAVQNLR